MLNQHNRRGKGGEGRGEKTEHPIPWTHGGLEKAHSLFVCLCQVSAACVFVVSAAPCLSVWVSVPPVACAGTAAAPVVWCVCSARRTVPAVEPETPKGRGRTERTLEHLWCELWSGLSPFVSVCCVICSFLRMCVQTSSELRWNGVCISQILLQSHKRAAGKGIA